MDSSAKISSPSQNKSMPKIIKKIHTMSWLKQDLPSSKNSKSTHQAMGKDRKVISQKKTDEDYFPGTKEGKKAKKKKEKKGKSAVVITDLQDLVCLTQENEQRLTTGEHTEEISMNNQPIVEKESAIVAGINTQQANGTVWSNTSSTAEKLFPNVQSVRIDRFEEEEMLSRAIAESITTVQLEHFKRLSPEKEDKWETLYGDFEDEGSWDNVRRNLPAELEATNSAGEASGQTKSRDDNNNSSKPGILRNTRTNLNRYLAMAREHDFCFKTSLESSKEESDKAQSPKSVSFDESISVKVRSRESSASDESEKSINENKKGPNIDKYGRVDGYSERRLFMGKGARIREQEYIQSQCSLGAGDLDLESNSKATAINNTRKSDLPASQCPKDVQAQEPILDVENPKSEKTIAVDNFHKTPETRFQKSESISKASKIVKTQKPAQIVHPPPPENMQSLKPSSDLENPKPEKAIVENNSHKTSEDRFQKSKSNSQASAIVESEKPAANTSNCPRNVQSQKSIPKFKNSKPEKAIVGNHSHKTSDDRFQKSKSSSQAVGIVKPQKSAPDTSRCPRNIQTQKFTPNFKNSKTEKATAVNKFHKTPEARFNKCKPNSKATAISKTQKPASNTSDCRRNLQSAESIPDSKNPKTEKAIAVKDVHKSPEASEYVKHDESDVEKSAGNIPSSDISSNAWNLGSSSSQKTDPQIEKQEVDSSLNEISSLSQKEEVTETTNVKHSQGKILSPDTTQDFLTSLKTPDDESDSGGPCLVPTLVKQEGYMPSLFASNFQQTESTFEVEFQSPARQNLLLAGVSCQDVNPDAPSFTPRYLDAEYSQYENYPTPDSASFLQSESWNNVHDTRAEFEDQIYQDHPINRNAYSMLPNYAKNYETAYFMHRFETGLPSANAEYLEPLTDLYEVPARNRTVDDRRRFFTAQAPPGFRRNLQLPPGFTRKVFRGYDRDERIQVTEKGRGPRSERVEFDDEKTPAENRPGYYKRNSRPVQTNSNPWKRQQNFYKPRPAGYDEEGSQFGENRKPYPILGASQRSVGRYSDLRRVQSKISQSSNWHRDAVDNNRSPNTRGNYRRPSQNNNYLFRSTQNRNSDFDYEEMDDPSQDSMLQVPVMFQMPDRSSPRLSNVTDWQYDLNFMDPAQVPMNLSPYYQMPMPSPLVVPENISPDYFHAPIDQNVGYQQLPMHLQMPMYSIPHLMNTGVAGARNMGLENIGSPDSS